MSQQGELASLSNARLMANMHSFSSTPSAPPQSSMHSRATPSAPPPSKPPQSSKHSQATPSALSQAKTSSATQVAPS
nr:hypothetical protein CFP56_25381 [Quercus suber]